MAYITASSVEVSAKEVEAFFLLMKGRTEGFSPAAVSNVFFSLCNDSSEGVTLSVNALLFAFDQQPEIYEGFVKFLPKLLDSDSITLEEFIDIHDDMHSSSPDNFQELLDTIWKV